MKPHLSIKTLMSLLFLTCLLPTSLLAANFTLSPVRVFFQADQRTDIINIKNNSQEEIQLQVSSYTWAQDQEAKDVLTETDDLIVFPKLLSVAPGQTSLLRIGKRVAPAEREQLYRVFIEELPGVRQTSTDQTTVRTLTKAGIPVFIQPLKAQARGELKELSFKAGTVDLAMHNTGNVHFMIHSVRIKGLDEAGNTMLEREAAGWYLHPSHAKTYSLAIPRQDCLKMHAIEAEVTTDKFSESERIDVIASMCGA